MNTLLKLNLTHFASFSGITVPLASLFYSWLLFTIRLALPSFDPVVTGAVVQVMVRLVSSWIKMSLSGRVSA